MGPHASRRRAGAAVLLAAGLAGLSARADEVFSGPQKGEKTPGFKVLDMNGPHAGGEFDYLSEWQGAPTLLCFIHELTRPGAQLLRRLDDYGQRNRDSLRTLFVSLSEDLNQGERNLPRSIKALGMKCTVGISLDGKEGPGAYGLNKQVTLTVIAARDGKVAGNWAIVSPNETDFPRIQSALDKLLEPALDTPEAVRAEVLRLRAELSALRAEVESLRRGEGRAAPSRGMDKPAERAERGEKAEKTDKRPLAGKPPEDPRLRELLRALIRPQASQEEVDRVIGEIESHVKGSADLEKQIAEAIALVDQLGYGTDYSKTARKKLLDKSRK